MNENIKAEVQKLARDIVLSDLGDGTVVVAHELSISEKCLSIRNLVVGYLTTRIDPQDVDASMIQLTIIQILRTSTLFDRAACFPEGIIKRYLQGSLSKNDIMTLFATIKNNVNNPEVELIDIVLLGLVFTSHNTGTTEPESGIYKHFMRKLVDFRTKRLIITTRHHKDNEYTFDRHGARGFITAICKELGELSIVNEDEWSTLTTHTFCNLFITIAISYSGITGNNDDVGFLVSDISNRVRGGW